MKKGEKDGLKMAKKSERDTKGRIINAAWQLFLLILFQEPMWIHEKKYMR